MPPPLCFVLMPFGHKPSTGGMMIDFDAVYRDLIKPAIEDSELEPLRADEEMGGGIIHKPMFERLILCPYAVCDLTTANANVFYELGVRHAVRSASTVLLFATGTKQLPFDVAPLRALPYRLGNSGKPTDIYNARTAIAHRLRESRDAAPDSPVYQLVDGFPDIQHLKTDVFRDRVRYSEKVKKQLATARMKGIAAVQTIASQLGNIADVEAAVVIDLFLSYRAVRAWKNMIELVPMMAPPLAGTVMVQEQLGLALNRIGRSLEAEQVLTDLITQRGPSSETYGILGRVYKDRWEAALKAGEDILASGILEKSIDAYLKGFEADWRDVYPGINALTLMELKDPPDPRQEKIIPVIAFAVERRIASGNSDYWDHATRLELAIITRDEEEALDALGDALARIRESWEPETTARNLKIIREAREMRGEKITWANRAEEELKRRAREDKHSL